MFTTDVAEDTLSRTVILLNPPSRDVQVRDFYCSATAQGSYCWAPIDLLVISARLNDRFGLAVIDSIAQGHSRRRALEEVLAAAPTVLIALTSSASYVEDINFLKEVKMRNPCLIAVVGSVCLDRDPWLLEAQPMLDALIADFTSPAIVDYVSEGGRSLRVLPGIVHRAQGRVFDGRNVPSAAGPLSYPVPRHDLFPLHAYRLPYARNHPIATIMTSYGCPFRCAYCIQSRSVIGYRSRSLEEVVEELDYLRSLGVRELYFRDPMFGADPALAKALCRKMRDGFDFSWSCDCRVDAVDEDIIALMKEAGCELIAFGMETSNQDALRLQKKTLREEDIRTALRLCRKHGLRTAGYFMLGLPGEDYDSSLATARFAIDSGVDFASFSIASPDFGTELRASAIAGGRIGPDYRGFDRNRVSQSLCERLDRGRLEELRRKAVRDFYGRPSYILRTLADLRSLRQLLETFRSVMALARNYL